jgi:GDP-4-dehydro-6-deoxy-D-mannose reductase
MRVLITGAAGFAGGHLVRHLAEQGHDILGVGRRPESPVECDYRTLDLLDANAVADLLAECRPEWVFHLAADASVSRSWKEPRETIRNNVETTLNVLEAARGARVLVAGSGEIYGPPRSLPVTEDHPLAPQNPYAISKATADLAGDVFAPDVVRTRAFNHFGPGQADIYVAAAFARQIAEAEQRGEKRVTVETGNLDAKRDFTDVRDVVRAYVLLMERAEPGPYNVCSGVARSAADILAALAKESPLEIEHRTDPARLRKNEVMDIHGSHEKLTNATGWQPEIAFETTIRDTLDWWRGR